MKSQIIRILFLLSCIIVVVVGLWPFSFGADNAVRRLSQDSGIEFYNLGIVFAGGPSNNKDFKRPLKFIDTLSIEIWLLPAKEFGKKTLTFFCLNDAKLPPPVMLGHWKSSLIIHTRGKGRTHQRKFKKLTLPNAMPKGEKRFLTITSGKSGTTIYLDGKRARFFPKYRLLNRNKSFSISSLVLGNDPIGKRPWNGQIFGLSIYDQELSEEIVSQNFKHWMREEYTRLSRQDGIIALYPMNEEDGKWIYNRSADRLHFRIPERFQVPKRLILSLPWADKGFKQFRDIVINVLGFIPFGFLGLAYFSSVKRAHNTSVKLVLIVVFLGGFLSLAVELLQVYLPTRYSSSTDLICNIFGTAAGAFSYHLAIRKLSPLNCCRAAAKKIATFE